MADPTDLPADDDHPSLVENVTHHPPRLAGPVILIVAMAAAGLFLNIATNSARAKSHMYEVQAIEAERLEASAEADAESGGAAQISTTLDALAQHLPASVSLALAEGRPGGAIRIAVDTPDPDLLRQALSADPWFDRFRERGQEQHDDGGFRVTLESR